MSKRQAKTSYWQDAPMPRDQLVLIATTLEDRIPEDHPVRILDEILSRMDWTGWEAVYHGRRGQPPIHPSVMCKVLLYATTRRIRHSRDIEFNLIHSIDFMWLASGREIDHSTLCKFRKKHSEQLKDIFSQMVRLALDMGVAKLSEVCIDGSRVRANASRFATLTADKVERLLQELDEEFSKALKELEVNDALDELFDDGQPANQLPSELRDMKARQEKLNAALARLREMDEQRKRDGIDPKKNPAQLPAADWDGRVLPNKEGGYAPNYTPMTVTETTNGFIIASDVLIGNVEHTVLTMMIDRIAVDFYEAPDTAEADTAYSTGANLEAMEARGIEFLSPLAQKEPEDNPAVREDPTKPVAEEDVGRLPVNPQTKCFGKFAFVHDKEEDCLWCPAGRKLVREGTEKASRSGEIIQLVNYRSPDCSGCPFASRCRKNPEGKHGRKVSLDGYEEIRRRHGERMRQPDAQERYKRRLHYGETPFAVIKTMFDLRQFLLRGIEGAQTEWLWACTAFNTQKLMRLWGAVCAGGKEKAVTGEA